MSVGAREAILAAVRRSLRRTGPLPPAMGDALEARLRTHPSHLRPALGDAGLVERFCERLQAAGGSAERVAGTADVPGAVDRHLAAHGRGRDLVVSPALELAWPEGFHVECRAARDGDATTVTGALAGVAETGTVVVASGSRSPTTLCFLPDDHIVVLPARQVVPHLEDAWARLRAAGDPWPRAVNLITGPSKTADVEQTLQTGAHGPRRFHVIVVDAEG